MSDLSKVKDELLIALARDVKDIDWKAIKHIVEQTIKEQNKQRENQHV